MYALYRRYKKPPAQPLIGSLDESELEKPGLRTAR